ncbi:hypothetical protein LTR01_003169 [Friedmanniomyces endolithicus]|nr:hypothetical protein LTR01_003169 [Friedmanniomyces endolithicus]KAK0825890.1 hypothetical protein LTR73_006624 [Friedmanniomyces endolithicus]
MSKQTQKEWRVAEATGFDGLKLNESAPIPEIGDKEVLVKFHGSSLNYRDLIIAKGMYPFPCKANIVPASDGAGIVEAVGKHVHRFKKGDKVLTLFNQGHVAGSLDGYSLSTGVGGSIDGCLRQYGAYDEDGLVTMPSNLNYLEGSTLTCAGLTAWNALYGLESRKLMPGEWVLTQGTGGVSIFGVQFAKAAGARVIATTSSKEKGEKLKQLGADHVINYKEDSNWGETAKKLTGGSGVQHVIEVGGPNTVKQSLKAIAIDGVITIIGFLGGVKGEEPSFVECLNNVCTVRGVLVGSRMMFEQMNRAVEANNIKPLIDQKTFKLEEAKEAYQTAQLFGIGDGIPENPYVSTRAVTDGGDANESGRDDYLSMFQDDVASDQNMDAPLPSSHDNDDLEEALHPATNTLYTDSTDLGHWQANGTAPVSYQQDAGHRAFKATLDPFFTLPAEQTNRYAIEPASASGNHDLSGNQQHRPVQAYETTVLGQMINQGVMAAARAQGFMIGNEWRVPPEAYAMKSAAPRHNQAFNAAPAVGGYVQNASQIDPRLRSSEPCNDFAVQPFDSQPVRHPSAGQNTWESAVSGPVFPGTDAARPWQALPPNFPLQVPLAPTALPTPSDHWSAPLISSSPTNGFGASMQSMRRSTSESPQPRKASRKQARASPWSTGDGENPVCSMCQLHRKKDDKPPKRFKASDYNQGMYCNKHTAQLNKDKIAAQPPIYVLDNRPEAGSAQNTIEKAYPIHPPLNYDNDGDDDDFQHHLGHENFWVARFIEAANTVYTRPDESMESQDKEKVADRERKHINAVKQQQLYNYKPHEDSSKDFYTNEWVNARMRLLFREVLVYHQGGRSIYAIGGTNNGYGEDRKLKFTARLRVILEAMMADKRVVMDVIEGRGVTALAMNPKRFADRKNSNNKCNENKKRKLDLVGGESVDGGGENEGGVVSVKAPSMTPSSRRRSARRATVVRSGRI